MCNFCQANESCCLALESAGLRHIGICVEFFVSLLHFLVLCTESLFYNALPRNVVVFSCPNFDCISVI